MILEADQLSAGYGALTVLHEVTVQVDKGGVLGIVGANGAGKSTLLGTLAGLLPARTGRIRLDGLDITALPAHRRTAAGLSLVPEGRRVFPRLTVGENLAMGAWTRTDRAEVARSLERNYALFPVLAERRTQTAGTLSGGEQQMLAIARALMANPRVLLLDEPSMGVAPMVADRLFAVIAGLAKDGLAIVLVEQDAHRALALADHALVLETGRIALSGTAEELRRDARIHAAYLGGD